MGTLEIPAWNCSGPPVGAELLVEGKAIRAEAAAQSSCSWLLQVANMLRAVYLSRDLLKGVIFIHLGQ